MATPRKPQDRKPAEPTNAEREEARAALELMPELSETPGHELLKPLSELDGFEQAELLLALEDSDDPNAALMKLARTIRDNYVVDAEKFDAFNRGEGAAGRLLNLTGAYVAAMGKGAI